jgi:colanic acid/amylovoran biosynthesis protein
MKLIINGIGYSGNYGVYALLLSFLKDLDEVGFIKEGNSIEIINGNFNSEEGKYILRLLNIDRGFSFTNIPLSFRNPLKFRKLYKEIKSSDYLIEFGGGDSFSDIYGIDRLLIIYLLSRISRKHKIKRFLLGPQTYGPFKTKISKRIAKKVIQSSLISFSRDSQSISLLNGLKCSNLPTLVTDMAFSLPYDKTKYSYLFDRQKLKVGLNVSGLLFNEPECNKKYNIRFSYSIFIQKLISYLLTLKDVVLYLVPHVVGNDKNVVDNDYYVCEMLSKKYPKAVFANNISNPIDAKSFISNLDIFIGSRMHATIAAFSSGVFTIPLAYSKKFSGVFGSLGYDGIINLTNSEENDVFQQIIRLIEERERFVEKQKEALKLSDQRNQFFLSCLKKIMG